MRSGHHTLYTVGQRKLLTTPITVYKYYRKDQSILLTQTLQVTEDKTSNFCVNIYKETKKTTRL